MNTRVEKADFIKIPTDDDKKPPEDQPNDYEKTPIWIPPLPIGDRPDQKFYARNILYH